MKVYGLTRVHLPIVCLPLVYLFIIIWYIIDKYLSVMYNIITVLRPNVFLLSVEDKTSLPEIRLGLFA
jgi:hypothetical protein